MRISLASARRRPRAAIATGIAALMVLVGAGFAAADITGPDVASYQHPGGASIDWSQVKNSGRNFAFVKATEGTGYVNPYFSADWAAIQANGMVRGSYHYAKPNTSPTSAAEQAQYFVATAGLMQATGDLAPILDFEDSGGLSPSALITWVHSWLNTITALTGRTPIIYTYPYFWQSAMGNNTGFTQYPLWIADYNGGSAPNTPLIGGWNSWTFWQYTDAGSIPGVSTGVDISKFCCDSGTLSSLSNGATPTPPSAILAHYTALGGASSYLGQVNGAEYAVPGGRAQNFTGGIIYWSPTTGAYEVHGAILDHYLTVGGPSSPLGLPTTDESPSADGVGRYNNFATGGALYWSPTVGAHEVHGAIDGKWGALGWEMGPQGYPPGHRRATVRGRGRAVQRLPERIHLLDPHRRGPVHPRGHQGQMGPGPVGDRVPGLPPDRRTHHPRRHRPVQPPARWVPVLEPDHRGTFGARRDQGHLGRTGMGDRAPRLPHVRRVHGARRAPKRLPGRILVLGREHRIGVPTMNMPNSRSGKHDAHC